MKSLLGDNSDNLTGIKGLGPKTLIKEFPDLVNKPGVTLDDIYQICVKELETKKVFAKIVYDWDKVKSNYELMNLLQPRLGDYEIVHILDKLKQDIPPLQATTFVRMLEADQIEALNKNVEGWLEVFRPLTTYKK